MCFKTDRVCNGDFVAGRGGGGGLYGLVTVIFFN